MYLKTNNVGDMFEQAVHGDECYVVICNFGDVIVILEAEFK